MENKTSVEFLITMEFAYNFLVAGVLSVTEYSIFLKEMYEKYKDENTRILYQSKLAIYQDKSD